MRRVLFTILLPIFFFMAASPATAEWDDRFGFLGPTADFNWWIWNLWVEGNDLYVVGGFTTVDGMPANGIAKWDGAVWSTVGDPVFGSLYAIYAITRYQGNLVVAGDFVSVNGQPGDVAVWDGVNWSTLGNGPLVDDAIVSLQVIGTDLYLGGGFTGLVARWDGATTTQLVTNAKTRCCASPGVFDLTSWNGDLIAAGNFITFDGDTLNHVGRWDGSQWSAMGSGFPVFTVDAYEHNGDLYMQYPYGIYKWTGTQWIDAVSEQAGCQHGGSATEALFYNGDLYKIGVGDIFGSSQRLYDVAKWTGSEWDDMRGGLGRGCGNYTGSLAEYDGRLLVGGEFTTAGGIPVTYLASWTGDAWYTNSPSDRVGAITASETGFYLAGDFTAVVDMPANHVARWDGTDWSALGDGVDGVVHDMVMIAGDLYVGGEFTVAGGTPAKNLARWDGAAWSPVSDEFGNGPIDGPVYALTTDGTDLYVGGSFVSLIPSQSLLLFRVGRWDGTQWHALGNGVTNGAVRAIATNGADTYVGGDFTQVEFSVIGNMAKWDGAAWWPLEYGLDDTVRSLEIHGGQLYAGGDFTHKTNYYSQDYKHIARWNGTEWRQVGGEPTFGVDQPVYDMASGGSGLIVVGEFTTAGAVAANHIAAWDGAQWGTFGEGLNKTVDAVSVSGGDVWVGGQFEIAGAEGSPFIAHWTDPTGVGDMAPPYETTLLEAPYPNPFNPQTTIRYRVAKPASVDLAIFDAGGRRVRTLVRGVPSGLSTQTVTWDGRADDGRPVASGVYFVRLLANHQSYSRKLVLLK